MAIIKETTKPAIKTYQLNISEEELKALHHALFIFNREHSDPYPYGDHARVLELLLAEIYNKKG